MSACPRCKSWEENSPLNWIIVATVSGVVTAVLTAVLMKAWSLSLEKRIFAQKINASAQFSSQFNQGKYRVVS